MRGELEVTRRHLLELPELYALLPLFLLPGSPAGEERTAASSPKRPPGSLAILDLLDTREKADAEPVRVDFDLDRRAGARRQGVLPTLASWTRLVDGELWDEGRVHGSLAEVPTVSSECGFLLEHLGWVAEQQWFDELAADVGRMRADMRSAVREFDLPPLVCPTETCRWPVEIMDDWSWFRCTGCDRTWTRIEVWRLYERQRPMHLSDCAKALGRPLRTLQRWVKDGLVPSVGRDTGGALFRLIDVQGAALSVVENAPAPPDKVA